MMKNASPYPEAMNTWDCLHNFSGGYPENRQPWWPGDKVAQWFTEKLSWWLNFPSKEYKCKNCWDSKGETKSEWNNKLNNLHHMLSVSTCFDGGWLPLWVQNWVPVVRSSLLHCLTYFQSTNRKSHWKSVGKFHREIDHESHSQFDWKPDTDSHG